MTVPFLLNYLTFRKMTLKAMTGLLLASYRKAIIIVRKMEHGSYIEMD